MTIQWSNGFEDIYSPGSNSPSRCNGVNTLTNLGWDWDYTGTGMGSSGIPGFAQVTGFRVGNAVTFESGQSTDTATLKPYAYRSITYGTTSSCLHINRRSLGLANRVAIGLFSPTQNIYVRQNGGNFLQLYINNTLVQTGTIDIHTGSPWHSVEMFFDVATSTVQVFINGVVELAGTIPVGFSPNQVRIFSDKTSGTIQGGEIQFDDIIFYVNRSRIGPMKAYGYTQTGSSVSTFNNGDGSNSSVTSVNTYTTDIYRASNVRGNQDLLTFNNILPAGTEFTSIVALNHKIAAAESGFFGSALERVLVSGGTTVAEPMTGLQPFAANTFERIHENNPNTSAPWTQAEIQAIQTGYRVGQYGQLAFTTQPSATGTQNTNLTVQPIVEVRTAGGSLDTTFNGKVYLFENGNPSLNSRIEVNAVAGIATFSGVQFTGTGVVQLVAVCKGRQSATSNNITIS